MKKLFLILPCLVAFTSLQAQDYKITFAGTGASTNVNTVKAENLTQSNSITMNGNDTLVLSGSVGIKETELSDVANLRIHPNPLKESSVIDFTSISDELTSIGIYDLTGKAIILSKKQLPAGRHSYLLSGLNSGIYILKIETARNSYVSRIVSTCDGSGTAALSYSSSLASAGANSLKELRENNAGRKSTAANYTLGYKAGDIIKLTGQSGDYETVTMLDDPALSTIVSFIFETCMDGGNNLYTVVRIGDQSWMGSNLRTTKYIDGTAIPSAHEGTAWSALSSPGYCYYNSDSINNDPEYGLLYNWWAVNTGKLCPTGWHIPSEIEWLLLIDFLGGELEAGGKLKSTGTTDWFPPNNKATNETGFSGLPGGLRDGGGIYYGARGDGYWWSTTKSTYSNTNAFNRHINSDNGAMEKQLSYLGYGYSVRCVKDGAR